MTANCWNWLQRRPALPILSGLRNKHLSALCRLGKAFVLSGTPLTDDGDALRLAVKLGIVIDTSDGVHVQYIVNGIAYPINIYEFDDIYAATRRAIVRAAAAIGAAK